MSVRVMAQVWELDIPAFEKLVLLALADCANDEGLCWPSINTLRVKTNAAERTVQRSLKALDDGGHITRRQVPGKGCKYTINPRQCGTPARTAPPPHRRQPPPHRHHTPATVTPKPSMNHQEPPLPSARARNASLPIDWKPALTPRSQQIVSGWPDGMIDTELEKFRDHASDKGRTSKDWQAAFRKWIDNAEAWRPKNGTANRTSRTNGTGHRSNKLLAIDEALDLMGS